MATETFWGGCRLALIDLGRRTSIRKQVPRFAASQFLPRPEMEALQLARLQDILEFALEQVPFYQRWLEKGSQRPRAANLPGDLGLLPVVTKEMVRREPAAFCPQTAGLGPVFTRQTGGSTGDPLQYRVSADAFSQQWAALLRTWHWSGYRFGQAMATVGGGSVLGRRDRSYSGRVYHFLRRNRTFAAGKISYDYLAGVGRALRARPPRLLHGYPSVLYQLARQLLDDNLPLTGIGSVVTTSEMLFPGQRRLIAQACGAPVFDLYGCNEVNLICGECPEHAGRHLAMETALVEILDAQDRPLPPGQVGRIVATSLVNRAMVFLRYDTGDLGALDLESCPCGRSLFRINELQGRSRDLVQTPAGELIHGVEFNRVIMRFGWIDRYQAVQEDALRLTLNLSGQDPTPDQVAEVTAAVAALTGLQVEPVVNGPFATTAGQKARVVISRLEQDHDPR